MIKKLKLICLTSFIILTLVGCASSPSEDEKVALITNQKIMEVDKLEQLQLTYRFQNSMTRSEAQDFFNYIKSDKIIDEIGPIIQNATHHSTNIAKASLLYSNFWEKAYASGNLRSSLGVVAVTGLAISALIPDSPPMHTSSYYVKSSETEYLTADEVTKIARQKTLDATKDFFQSEGYEVICELGCTEDIKVEDNANIRLWLGLRQPEIKTTYHKHKAIQVNLKLNQLVKNEDDYSIFSNDQIGYKTAGISDWNIDLVGPNSYSSEVEKYGYKYDALNMRIQGTMIYRKFFQYITAKMPGYSAMHRGKYNIHYHVKEAYSNGKAYLLHDEFMEYSLIKGVHVE